MPAQKKAKNTKCSLYLSVSRKDGYEAQQTDFTWFPASTQDLPMDVTVLAGPFTASRLPSAKTAPEHRTVL